LNEKGKPKEEQNQEKMHKYQELYWEMQRQIDVVSGMYKNNTAQLIEGRVKRYMKKNRVVEELKKKHGKNLETHVQMGKKRGENGAKYDIKGDAEVLTTEDGKKIIVIDALKFTKGKIPHEIGHLLTEKVGFNEAEFDKLKKIIQPEVEANAADWLKEKNKTDGTNFKSLEELINYKYTEANQTGDLAQEYIMRVVEFFGDKDFTKGMIKGNAFFGINKGIKKFYKNNNALEWVYYFYNVINRR